jgi:N-formylglutamate amidohydrolase
MTLPDWVVLHVPHDSTHIPDEVRSQFVVGDSELHLEITRMTDHLTKDLFGHMVKADRVVYSPVSRLVVDVERFEDDAQEAMSIRGMGAIYSKTSDGHSLRRDLATKEREYLLETYYRPHHARLEDIVNACLRKYQRALIIDAHSFPSVALPYEVDQSSIRADFCIGTDAFHTAPELRKAFVEAFSTHGYSVAVDTPFSGSMVPASKYLVDARVQSIMVEVNRRLYLDEDLGVANSDFVRIKSHIGASISSAITNWGSWEEVNEK